MSFCPFLSFSKRAVFRLQTTARLFATDPFSFVKGQVV